MYGSFLESFPSRLRIPEAPTALAPPATRSLCSPRTRPPPARQIKELLLYPHGRGGGADGWAGHEAGVPAAVEPGCDWDGRQERVYMLFPLCWARFATPPPARWVFYRRRPDCGCEGRAQCWWWRWWWWVPVDGL